MKLFCWPVRVYFEDTDSGGIVYYANYLKFMERARTEWLRESGFQQDVLLQQEGIIFIVRSATVDYHRPARFNDLLEIQTRVNETRRVSLLFEQTVVNTSAPGEALCQAQIRVACVSANTFKPKPIPKSMLLELSNGH